MAQTMPLGIKTSTSQFTAVHAGPKDQRLLWLTDSTSFLATRALLLLRSTHRSWSTAEPAAPVKVETLEAFMNLLTSTESQTPAVNSMLPRICSRPGAALSTSARIATPKGAMPLTTKSITSPTFTHSEEKTR